MSQVILPKVPSELLSIALKDLKNTIKAGITINMNSWGTQIGTNDCAVCFAGSVMLQTEKQKPDNSLCFNFEGVNQKQYQFLDEIRKGDLNNALSYLDLENKPIGKYEGFATHIEGWKVFGECSNKVFFKQISDLIKYLKSKGL